MLARRASLLSFWTRITCTVLKENFPDNPTWNTVLALLQSTSLFDSLSEIISSVYLPVLLFLFTRMKAPQTRSLFVLYLSIFSLPSNSFWSFYFIYKIFVELSGNVSLWPILTSLAQFICTKEDIFKRLFLPLTSSKHGRNMVRKVFWFVITVGSYQWVIEKTASL